MIKYTVTYDDGQNQGTLELNAPDRLPQAGDVYEWVTPGQTVGGNTYNVGDRMTILGRTPDVPHHRTSSLGNLMVQSKYSVSVWTCFEDSVNQGSLKLVSSLRADPT